MTDHVWTLLAVLLGGLISAATSFLSQKQIERRSKNELLMMRLEEADGLSQAIYDAHRKIIGWLSNREKLNKNDWAEAPPHPGDSMARLKMIVSSYAPEALSELKQLDEGHQKLKKVYRNLDTTMAERKEAQREQEYLTQQLEQDLEILGFGANALKARLRAKLRLHFA